MGLGAWLLFFLLAAILVGALGRLLARADDERLAQLIARLAPSLSCILTLCVLAWLGAGLWMALGLMLGLLGFLMTRPAKEPSSSQTQAARSCYKEAARLLESYDPAESEQLEAELQNLIVEAEMAITSYRPTVARLLSMVGDYYFSQQKFLPAGSLYGRALRVFQAHNCPKEAAVVGYNLAVVHLNAGRPQAGIAQCQAALEITEDTLQAARLFRTLSELQASESNYKAAAQAAVKALSNFITELGTDHPETLALTYKTIDYLVLAGDRPQAARLIDNALRMREELQLLADTSLVFLLSLKARLAGGCFQVALEALKAHGGCGHQNAQEILKGSLEHLLDPSWSEAERLCWTALVLGDQNDAMGRLREQPSMLERLDKSGWSALHWIIFWGHERLFDSLIFDQKRRFPSGSEQPTLVAARWMRRPMLVALLKRGYDAQVRDAEGRGLVHRAAQAGDARSIGVLLERGLSLDLPDGDGRTPLHLAALRAHHEVVLELLAGRCNPDQPDNQGYTPLHLALYAGHQKTVEILLNNGATLAAGGPGVRERVLERVKSLSQPQLLAALRSQGVEL